MIVDFFIETHNQLTLNVTNKVYFQAWATSDRVDVFEFANASLKAVLFDNSTLTIVDSTVRTEHRGKGSFNFQHKAIYQEIYLEIPIITDSTKLTILKRTFYLSSGDQTNEVTLTVLAKNKVFEKTLSVLLNTNDLVSSNDNYLV